MATILSTTGAVWRRAKKTQGIRAKPIVTLVVDRSVMSKFLIDTLEGREPISTDNMFCIGAAGDAWQQSSKALLKKYDVKAVDSEGWMVCEPRPENEVEFFEFDENKHRKMSVTPGTWVIQGLWGETIDGVEKLQRIKDGDFVCRQPHEHGDQWVVHRVLFRNTYSELGAK
jgi:hypothetical protein